MIQQSKASKFFPHVVLWLAIIIIIFPIYLVFVASTRTSQEIISAPMPLLPGNQMITNYTRALLEGAKNLGASAFTMMKNSFIMAMGISVGKIAVSLLAAFAIVFFNFKGRKFCFWAIFITLMLPVEVRIMPTYKVISQMGLMNTYAGLILPMIVSATAVFLFRQFFMSIPREIAEASQIDGATSMQFFRSILIPMTRTPIAAMFVIQFIYGWNQYLWPLLITQSEKLKTIPSYIVRYTADLTADEGTMMAVAVIAAVPVFVLFFSMSKYFLQGAGVFTGSKT